MQAARRRHDRHRFHAEGPCDERCYAPTRRSKSRPPPSRHARRPASRTRTKCAECREREQREILRLKWSDVDFEARRLAVYRSKVGNFSWLPMHPVLAGELREMFDRRSKDGPAPRSDEPVFFSRLGKPYVDFRGGWEGAVKRAGLSDREGVTPHCARHTFACHFLDNGAAVTDLSEILGHASLGTTQIYARMVDRRTRESVEAMDFGG